MTIDRLTLDYSYALPSLPEGAFDAALREMENARKMLLARNCPGKEFLGWLDLPNTMRGQLPELIEWGEELVQRADVLLVVGIGGSYLGARAAIDACTPFFSGNETEIRFAGHQLSGGYLKQLLSHCEGKQVFANVISKSGTTTEPALAFRVIRRWMEKTYGRREASKRIIVTTDAEGGALRKLAREESYRSLVIPDDVGGRFSVLTPVGLLPIAAAGLNIGELLDGASEMRDGCLKRPAGENPAMVYASLRRALYRDGKNVELLATFQPELASLAEWWKQLFGESEGKDGRGIFPASVQYTTDLHSMGQYIQEGRRILFETFLTATDSSQELLLPEADGDEDGLNYLSGKPFSFVNQQAYVATAMAHYEGGVPNMTVMVPSVGEWTLGALVYFFEFAVALGGIADGVNPFDQPGVEAYKRNMFALLGKPGFETERDVLRNKLNAIPRHRIS